VDAIYVAIGVPNPKSGELLPFFRGNRGRRSALA
jgi:hypothetical protein